MQTYSPGLNPSGFIPIENTRERNILRITRMQKKKKEINKIHHHREKRRELFQKNSSNSFETTF